MSDAVTGTPEDQAHEDDAPEALDAPPGPTGSPASQDGAYCVATDAFEGPLDLLLYLIRKEQVSVYDIPIARITEQYLGTLKLMQELNLDVAGDFLVMAATLLQIKSRMLLPQPPELDGDEEGEGLDPRAELVRALLEFERYRQVPREQLARQGVVQVAELLEEVHSGLVWAWRCASA